MEWASLFIAIAAVLISAITAIRERHDRRAELDLLRQQIEAAQGEREAQSRAGLYAERGTITWEPCEYNFIIGNAGPAVARSIEVWLCARDTTTSRQQLPPLQAGDVKPVKITLGRPLAYIEGRKTLARLMAAWSDDGGAREEALLEGLPSGP